MYIGIIIILMLFVSGCSETAAPADTPESLIDMKIPMKVEDVLEEVDFALEDDFELEDNGFNVIPLFDLEVYNHPVHVTLHYEDEFEMEAILPFAYYAEDVILETEQEYFIKEGYPEIAEDFSQLYLESDSTKQKLKEGLQEYRDEDPEYRELRKKYDAEMEEVENSDIQTQNKWLFYVMIKFKDELDGEERDELIKDLKKQLGKPVMTESHGVYNKWEREDGFVTLSCHPAEEVNSLDEEFHCSLSKELRPEHFKEVVKEDLK